MEFDVAGPVAVERAAPRAAIVLACTSKLFFQEHLRVSGAQPLVLTTQLMAPEAYTLDAAVRAWFSGEREAAVCSDSSGNG